MTSQLESPTLGQAWVIPMLAPREAHCSFLLVQYPEAHFSPLSPQLVPSAFVSSGGQSAEVPVHVSAMSHVSVIAGRQTWPDGAYVQVEEQQVFVAGSHWAPARSLHVDESQQSEVAPWPGSHSSPGSRIPFPHCCRLV